MEDNITIQLPEGYYFETSSFGRVVSINVNKNVFSVGDYLKDVINGHTFIVTELNTCLYKTTLYLDSDGVFRERPKFYSADRDFYRLNDEEKKAFDDKMRNVLGIEYNVEENKYVRCRAEKYYFIDSSGDVFETTDTKSEKDNDRYRFGNYFTNKDQAKSYLCKIKLLLKRYE